MFRNNRLSNLVNGSSEDELLWAGGSNLKLLKSNWLQCLPRPPQYNVQTNKQDKHETRGMIFLLGTIAEKELLYRQILYLSLL